MLDLFYLLFSKEVGLLVLSLVAFLGFIFMLAVLIRAFTGRWM